MKLCVTGGRTYADRATLFEVLDLAHELLTVDALAYGAARGADALADAWCHARGVTRVPFPADWKRHPRAAGPIRNRQMLLGFQPDVLIAFPGGSGTADCVAAARGMGVRVVDLREMLGDYG